MIEWTKIGSIPFLAFKRVWTVQIGILGPTEAGKYVRVDCPIIPLETLFILPMNSNLGNG